MLSIGDVLTQRARQSGSKAALTCGKQTYSFAQLNALSNHWAHALTGVVPNAGGRVALLLPNGLNMALAYFALAKAGLIAVPLNLRWKAPELAFALQHAKVSMIIAAREFRTLLRQIAPPGVPVFYTEASGPSSFERLLEQASWGPLNREVSEHDPWALVYTSGTTGRPKGVLRSQHADLMIALLLTREVGIGADDVGMAILPMFHVNSMWFVTLSVLIGASTVIWPEHTFHPRRLLEGFAQHHITYTMLVPTLLSYLADACDHERWTLPDLRVLMTSSAPLDASLRQRLLRLFPAADVYNVYGASEIGAATCSREENGGPAGTVGYPLVGLDVQILNAQGEAVPAGQIGQVYIGGPTLMRSYWRNPAATHQARQQGLVTVGDMGYLAEDGRLTLVDRRHDLILVSGENVYPSEVEQVLLSDPDVALAAVVGIADLRRGQRPVALVVPKAGRQVSSARLMTLCGRSLADYKRPVAIEVVASLPLGPAGKIVRRLAKEQWLQSHP